MRRLSEGPSSRMTKVSIYRGIRDDREDDECGVQRQQEDRRALAASTASRSSGRRSTPTSDPRHPGAGEDPPAYGEMFRAGAGGKSPHIIAYPNVRITRRVLELEDSTRLNPHAREDLALTRCGLRCSNPAQASEPGLVAASPGVGPRHEDLRGDESADARSGEETATSLAELGLRPCHLIRRAHGVASGAMSRSVRPLRARPVLLRPRAPGSTRLRSRRVHCAARSPRQRR